MNANISIESSVLEQKALEALSTAIFYRNALANAPNGYDLLNDPHYRNLLAQLQASKTNDSPSARAINRPQAMPTADTSIFYQLQDAISKGTYRERFPVGTILPDTWTDPETGGVYNMPLRIVDYRKALLSSGHKALGATLLRVNASPNEMMFGRLTACFSGSFVQEYLNSAAADAYLAGCSVALREAMAVVVIRTPSSNACDTTHCSVFLPSPEDLHVDVSDKFTGDELNRMCWEYFRDTPTDPHTYSEKRVFSVPNGWRKPVWLRTCTGNSAYCVNANGGANSDSMDNDHSILPACVVISRKAQQVAQEGI